MNRRMLLMAGFSLAFTTEHALSADEGRPPAKERTVPVNPTPPGFPDIAYLGGQMSYSQLGINNGRAVLLSTDAGVTWSDMSQDSDPTHAEFTHPDQHAIVHPHQ